MRWLEQSNVLEHPTRLRIYEYIREKGAATARELRTLTETEPRSTMVYHLEELQHTGMIEMRRLGLVGVYVPTPPPKSRVADIAACIRREPEYGRVLCYFGMFPGSTVTEMTEGIGTRKMNAQRSRVMRLAKWGALERDGRNGRTNPYKLTADGTAAIEKLADEDFILQDRPARPSPGACTS